MAIRWDLLGPPADIGGAFQQGFEGTQKRIRAGQRDSALRAYIANPNDPGTQSVLAQLDPQFGMQFVQQRAQQAAQEAERARLAQYGSMAVRDPRAARTAALEAGDFDLAKTFDRMSADEQKQTENFFKAATPLAYDLLKITNPEQRRLAFEKAKPVLLASGADPDTVNGFNVDDDGALGAIVSMGETLAAKVERNEIKYVPVGPGARLVPFRNGLPVGSDTGNAAPVAPSAAALAPAASDGRFTFSATPGAKVTSAYRSPADNRRVGGVKNSFHLTGQARDFTPPPGMSMDELEADLRRRNPGLDVINEGDHVHIEPSGRPAPRTAQADKGDERAKALAAIRSGAPREQVARMYRERTGKEL
jgi:hypothetical protein